MVLRFGLLRFPGLSTGASLSLARAPASGSRATSSPAPRPCSSSGRGRSRGFRRSPGSRPARRLSTAPSRAEAPTTAIVRGRSKAFIASCGRFIDRGLDEGQRIEAQPPDHVKQDALIAELGEPIEPTESLAAFADEPDNRILEYAMASGAQVVAPGTVRCWRSASTEVFPSSPGARISPDRSAVRVLSHCA